MKPFLASCALIVVAVPSTYSGPMPERSSPSPAEVALGRALFEAPALSSDGKVSCASCHDPARSFTDGRTHAVGVDDNDVGRNSPTLVALKHVEAFPGAAPADLEDSQVPGTLDSLRQQMKTGSAPLVLSLAERCIAPIENPAEMNMPVGRLTETLNADMQWRVRFDDVYGEPGTGVTRERIGDALAAFVSSLSLPDSAYARYLAGDVIALSPTAQEGLRIFEGRGRCADCHSGPGLTDGRIHGATTQQTILTRERIADLAKRDRLRGDAAKQFREGAPRDGANKRRGYGRTSFEGSVQTLTLWDIGRTAPYFRDGSVATLEEAVRVHIDELQKMSVHKNAIRETAALPEPLAPRFEGSRPPAPDALEEVEVGWLMDFLAALTPDAGVAAEDAGP